MRRLHSSTLKPAISLSVEDELICTRAWLNGIAMLPGGRLWRFGIEHSASLFAMYRWSGPGQMSGLDCSTASERIPR